MEEGNQDKIEICEGLLRWKEKINRVVKMWK